MSDTVIKITTSSENSNEEFFDKMHQLGFTERYRIRTILFPEHEFTEEFLGHICENGFSSLFYTDVSMEDITSKSMSLDEIEKVISRFLDNLRPVNRLLIIDPFFYASSPNSHCVLERILTPLKNELKEVAVVFNNRYMLNADNMRNAINSVNSSIAIKEIPSDEFHDRFWINPNNVRGLVMGTSLNGISKKIALIDQLEENDVYDLLQLAVENGYKNEA